MAIDKHANHTSRISNCEHEPFKYIKTEQSTG